MAMRAHHLRLPSQTAMARGHNSSGQVAEWFKATVLKTVVGGSSPWVRIPPCPPLSFRSTSNAFEFDKVAPAAAVPEPTTWMLMLMGMAGIGFTIRRKRDRLYASASHNNLSLGLKMGAK